MSFPASLLNTVAGVAGRVVVPPLRALDQKIVVPRLGENSAVHHTLALAVGVLGAHAVAGRDAQDVPTRGPAPQDDRGDSTDGVELPAEEQDEIARVTEQLLAEQGDQHFVGELADDELRRAQAEIRAKQIVEERDRSSDDEDGSG